MIQKAVLITGTRPTGLKDLSESLAWHFSPTEEGIIEIDWLFDNCENWEHDERTWLAIQPDTKVVIINNLPDYFDYNRLCHIYLKDNFLIEQEGASPIKIPIPALILTSKYRPRMDVSKVIRKHYSLRPYNNPNEIQRTFL